MKRFALTVLSLCMVSGMAVASQDTLLQLQIVPVMGIAGGMTTTLKVDTYGDVSVESCHAVAVNPCTTQTVKTLSEGQLERLETLIEEAKDGKDITAVGITCHTVTIQVSTYSADNGSLFLKSQDFPCGLPTYNDSSAAAKLVKFLDRLYAQSVKSPFAAN